MFVQYVPTAQLRSIDGSQASIGDWWLISAVNLHILQTLKASAMCQTSVLNLQMYLMHLCMMLGWIDMWHDDRSQVIVEYMLQRWWFQVHLGS